MQGLNAAKKRLGGAELVERLFLEGNRSIADRVKVRLARRAAEVLIGLQDAARRGTPLGPLAWRQDARHELGLDALHVGRVVEALDDGAQRPLVVGLHAVLDLVAGHGRANHPEVVVGEDVERADGHFQRHSMAALLEKVDHELIVLDRLDPTESPGAMKHIMAFVETDVFFEVGDCFVDVAPGLAQIGNLDVVVEMAVPGVPVGVYVDKFAARPIILGIVVQDTLQYRDRGIPVLGLAKVWIEDLQE